MANQEHMGGQQAERAGGFRLDVDERGAVVCIDDSGKRVPLGRCFQLAVAGDDPKSVRVKIRRSCTLGEKFNSEFVQRVKNKGQTVYALADDDAGEWE